MSEITTGISHPKKNMKSNYYVSTIITGQYSYYFYDLNTSNTFFFKKLLLKNTMQSTIIIGSCTYLVIFFYNLNV